eukprot:gene1240-1639_t
MAHAYIVDAVRTAGGKRGGKIMLAEFIYDGVVAPSFPIDPRIPRRSYWWLKKYYLPYLYWEQMLRGRLGPDWHSVRSFSEAVPTLTP